MSQIPCFSCFVIVQFGGQLRSFCLKSCKNSRFLHGRRLESQATSILKGPPKRVRHTAPQRSRRRSPKEKENTSRSRMDVITPPPPIPPPPKPPHRVQKQVQVEAGMCRKSRDGQNTANTDAKGDTDRKTPKKTMRNGPPSRFLDQCRPPCARFFAKNTANTDKNRNLKINFGRGKCQNSSFSTCQPGNRRTPRGGRRTCCQQQQQQQQR